MAKDIRGCTKCGYLEYQNQAREGWRILSLNGDEHATGDTPLEKDYWVRVLRFAEGRYYEE